MLREDDMISRQAAIDAVHEEFDECLVWDESGETTANEIERILDGLPSVQPEIIRCEHCYHALEEGPKLWCTKGPISIRVNPIHFCGFAERREDEQTD